MKVNPNFYLNNSSKMIKGMIFALVLIFFTGLTVDASDKTQNTELKRDQSTILTGSGERYQTTVKRYTEGNLSSDDLHQVSLLTSRIVNHLNEASDGLSDQNPDQTRKEIENAQKLIKIVRDLLPITTVTTIVKDAQGREVYRDVDKIQDDRISLYQSMIAMEVVEPIISAKEKAAAIKGVRLADADIIHTSVLADLSYIERKMNRALTLLDKPEKALEQLELAQTDGVELVMNENDDPLVQIQSALKLAERMVQEGDHEAAQDNLRLAQIQLGAYRALIGKEDAKDVKKLEDEITALMTKTKEKGAADKIRNLWERVVDWFIQEPGQAHIVKKKAEVKTKQSNQ